MNSDLMRLVAWSALEYRRGWAERIATLDAKLAALTEAQKVSLDSVNRQVYLFPSSHESVIRG